MTRFIKLLVIFFLPIIVIGLYSETLLHRIPNDYLYKRNYLDRNSKDIKVLILGSSHAFYGLDPKYFKLKGFNASDISQSLTYDHAILKRYEAKWDHLKYIILPIDDFTLYTDLKKGAESWRVKNYEIYYDIHLSHHWEDRTEILSNNLNINGRRLYTYYVKNKGGLSCSELGWGNDYHSDHGQNLLTSGKIAAERHHVTTNENVEENVRVLTAIARFASVKHIRVILYTSPAYQTYVKYMNKDQLAATIKTISWVMGKYHNISYYNWFTDQSFQAGDFYDADHFNEVGARKFSVKMDSIINLMELK